MINKDILLSIIEKAFEELNALRDDAEKISFSTQAELYGPQSKLDSVDLVNLLLAIEEYIEDELDISFTITSEKALSLKNSPFRTVQTLCDYLQTELSN